MTLLLCENGEFNKCPASNRGLTSNMFTLMVQKFNRNPLWLIEYVFTSQADIMPILPHRSYYNNDHGLLGVPTQVFSCLSLLSGSRQCLVVLSSAIDIMNNSLLNRIFLTVAIHCPHFSLFSGYKVMPLAITHQQQMEVTVNHLVLTSGKLNRHPLKMQAYLSRPCMTFKELRMTSWISKKATSSLSFLRKMTKAGVKGDLRVKWDIFQVHMWNPCDEEMWCYSPLRSLG